MGASSRIAVALLLAGLLAACAGPTATDDWTRLVLVRHAEKQGGDDPALSPAGVVRAEALARVLRDAGATGLVASQFRRTRQTLEPLADGLDLPIDVIPLDGADPGAEARRVARELLGRYRGGCVVVAGHSNTLPPLLEALGAAPVPSIGHDDYDDLFVVDVGPRGQVRLTHLHYGAPSP